MESNKLLYSSSLICVLPFCLFCFLLFCFVCLFIHISICIFLFPACNEDLTDPSGYLFSPAYSGDVLNDIACTWYITVPRNSKIRLEFQDFHLPDHPTCKDCYLQIFDGSETSAPAIGRFCGYMYPPIVISSSNHLRIALRCAASSYTPRFSIFYNSTAGMKRYISDFLLPVSSFYVFYFWSSNKKRRYCNGMQMSRHNFMLLFIFQFFSSQGFRVVLFATARCTKNLELICFLFFI